MTATKKSKAALLISVATLVITLITALGLILGFTNAQQTTETVTPSMYARGAISATGKIVESNESLYLEDMQTVSSMKIELDEETATISYKVVFYDKDGKFISMTESYKSDYDVKGVPETAEFFRVVITPNEVDGEAVKLNIFNTSKYAKQLTVSFDKV